MTMRELDTTVSDWTVEQQYPQECLLATLAALSNTPYAIVRAKAHLYLRQWYATNIGSIPAGCSWSPHAVRHINVYSAVAASLLSLLNLPTISFSGTPPTGCEWTIPLQGQGYIRFLLPPNGSHITPWKEGLIYEVGSPNPMLGTTLSAYLALNSSFVVLAIETTGVKVKAKRALRGS